MTARSNLLAFLRERGAASFPEINRAMGVSRGHANVEILQALREGVLRREGVRRKYRYALSQGGRRVTSVFDLALA